MKVIPGNRYINEKTCCIYEIDYITRNKALDRFAPIVVYHAVVHPYARKDKHYTKTLEEFKHEFKLPRKQLNKSLLDAD